MAALSAHENRQPKKEVLRQDSNMQGVPTWIHGLDPSASAHTQAGGLLEWQYDITQKASPLNYRIAITRRVNCSRMPHVSMLKSWRTVDNRRQPGKPFSTIWPLSHIALTEQQAEQLQALLPHFPQVFTTAPGLVTFVSKESAPMKLYL